MNHGLPNNEVKSKRVGRTGLMRGAVYFTRAATETAGKLQKGTTVTGRGKQQEIRSGNAERCAGKGRTMNRIFEAMRVFAGILVIIAPAFEKYGWNFFPNEGKNNASGPAFPPLPAALGMRKFPLVFYGAREENGRKFRFYS